jgi:hypothetical protein
MGGTTEGCVASLKDACGEKNKRWRPFWQASYCCVEFSLWFNQEACNDILHNGHVINYTLMLLCDVMYDFAYLSVRRSIRESHWSKDYRDVTGIRVFFENPRFYSHTLAAMVGPVWWSHGGVPEPMPWFHQGNCTFYIRWWYKSCLFFTLIYINEFYPYV